MAWTKRAGMPKTVRKTHEIDAAGKVVGRLATHIATLLMGKHKASHVPHADDGDVVRVTNAGKIVLTGKKWEQKMHYRSANHPSGITATPMSRLREKNPGEILRHAVKYMLPKNRTQALRMKRLIIVK